jgi:photosystem II stability/assembly factor-like uncharacterized protein
MTPDERELRRALDARSAAPTPEFLARVSTSHDARPPGPGLMPTVAMVAAASLTLATIGVLLVASHLGTPVRHGPPVIGTGVASPTPSPTGKGGQTIYLPTDVQLSAPSGDIVWAFVADSLLFRSTDGGNIFEERSLPAQIVLPKPEISFVDSQNGWLATGGSPETQCNGDAEAIWRTTDGGATWRRVASVDESQQAGNGIALSQCKEGLSFVDQTHGFLAGWDANHRPTIYRTSDAGLTWASSTLPDPPGFVTQSGGFSLRAGLVRRFGDVLLLPAWGMQDGAPQESEYVFRSTDGGARWTFLAATGYGVDNVAMVSATRWLKIGNDGSAQETTEAGKTWHTFITDYSNAAGVAPTFVFGDVDVGYATVRGGIQRTLDGGAHWAIIETPGVFWPG